MSGLAKNWRVSNEISMSDNNVKFYIECNSEEDGIIRNPR